LRLADNRELNVMLKHDTTVQMAKFLRQLSSAPPTEALRAAQNVKASNTKGTKRTKAHKAIFVFSF